MTTLDQPLASDDQAIKQPQKRKQRPRQWRDFIPERWYVHVFLWIACFFVGLPLLYAFIISTQNNAEVLQFQFTPGDSFWSNLEAVMVNRNLGDFMMNSLLQAVIVTVGKTITALLAGLAFVYFRFPGKWLVFGFVLVTLMMPTEIIVIALFRLVSEFQFEQLASLTLPFLASATGAFLFRQHFANLPPELSEASQLDGATPLQFLFRVLIPLSWNTIGALAVIQFVYVWNMYLWPQLIQAKTVQVGLGGLLNFDGAQSYGPMMMGAVVASIPPVIIFIILQKQFMSGFAVTTDK